jgi:folate-dependent phosphoribosylglycinamide formyltransferase PurN
MKKNLVVFASGGKTGETGGTGAENLAQKLPDRVLVFISNHENGGVKHRADTLGVPFVYFPGPYTEQGYRELIEKICAEMGTDKDDLWYALSGWFRQVFWLPPERTVNIHPAPLPLFAAMWGEKLHQSVWEAYGRGEITEGEIVMHFVTPKIDDGPIFFRFSLPLSGIKNYDEYRETVRIIEHNFQPRMMELVMNGDISWDGRNPESLRI